MRHRRTTEKEDQVSAKESFFALQRYAVIGDWRTRRFPSLTKRYLEEKGKTVYPIDLAGAQPGFFYSVSEIPAEAQAAIVEVAPERSADAVRQTLDHGLTEI